MNELYSRKSTLYQYCTLTLDFYLLVSQKRLSFVSPFVISSVKFNQFFSLLTKMIY